MGLQKIPWSLFLAHGQAPFINGGGGDYGVGTLATPEHEAALREHIPSLRVS